MNRPFFLPSLYQNQANALPAHGVQAQTAYAGGQNQNMAGQWNAQVQDIHEQYRTTSGRGSWGGYNVPSSVDPVASMTQAYSAGTKAMPGDIARSQQIAFSGLGRVSGSMNRQVRQVRGNEYGPAMDISAFGSGSGTLGLGATVHANIRDLGRVRGFGAVAGPWYENPWYLGGGAVAIIAGVWFLTRKKR